MIEIGLGGLFLVLAAIFGCCYCCARNRGNNPGNRPNGLPNTPPTHSMVVQRWSDYRTFQGNPAENPGHSRRNRRRSVEPDRVDSGASQPPIYTINMEDQQLPKYEDLFPVGPPKVGQLPTYNADQQEQSHHQPQQPPPPES